MVVNCVLKVASVYSVWRTICSHTLICIALTISMASLTSYYPSNILVKASQSGIYVDNGHDQTIIHRALDEEEKVAASYEILEFLGLPERPRRRHSHLSLRKSAPQFLLDVYHRLKEEDNNATPPPSLPRSKRDLQEQENFITDLDKRAIDQSDIIMTFLNKNGSIISTEHLLSTGAGKNTAVYIIGSYWSQTSWFAQPENFHCINENIENI